MRTDARLVVLIAATLSMPVVCSAQPAGPRKFVVGVDFANGSFSSSTYKSSSDVSTSVYSDKSHSSYVAISPSLGIFLSDTLVVGSGLSFSLNRYSDDASSDDVLQSKSKSHSVYFSVGPFLRKYFGNPQGRGMPFVHIEGGISLNKYHGTYSPVSGTGYDYDERNYHPTYFEALVGYEMFITELLGLQYYGGYYYSRYAYDYFYDYVSGTDATYHYEGSTNEVMFGIGLRVYLHGKK